MSHWVKKHTEVLDNVEKKILKEALKEMGKDFDESINEISNSWGREKVDACLLDNGVATTLGFNFVPREDNDKYKLELVGDFFATGLNENRFMTQLSQMYQKHNVLDALEEQMWDIEELNTNNKGEIVIEASQWA